MKARDDARTLSRLALGAVLSAAFLVASALAFWLAYSATTRAHRERYAAYLLADELRQSSDDLTRLVRTYAATGDPRYEKWYWEVLAIRDGRSPRPDAYHRIYWDFVTAGLPTEGAMGKAVALDDLLKGTLTDREFALLRQAHARSDDLVKLETRAMNAMKGIFPDASGQYTVKGKPDSALALQLLFGPDYHAAKGAIMGPITEFMVELDKRTQAAVAAAEERARRWAVLFAASFVLLVACTGVSLWYYRTRVIRSLRESEKQFRAVFEAAGDSMMLLREGRFVDVNEATLTLFGCRRDQIVGRPPDAFSPPRQPDGRMSDEAARDRIAQAIRDGHLVFEWQHCRADRTPFDAEVGLTSFRLGREGYLLAMVRDVSARKQAEQARRLNEARLEAMQRLHQMIGEPEREILRYAMEEAVRLTGSTLGYVAFMNEDETVLHMQAWSDAAMEQCRVKDMPILYPVEQTDLWGEAVRQRRPVMTNDYAAPCPWKKGTPEGHVAVTRHLNLPVMENNRIVIVAGVGNKAEPYDDTDVRQLTLLMSGLWSLVQRKRSDEALRQMTATLEHRVVERTAELAESSRRLEAANQELEAFSYSVSHDLRSPLRHITGFADILQRHAGAALDDKGRHYLQTICQAALKMGHLIDDLLAFSRMGRVALHCVETPLGGLVDEVIRDLAPEVGDRHVEWIVEPLPSVRVDPAVFRQVLVNLVGNAVKYTRLREHARIEIGSRLEGGEIVLHVRDNGVGFGMQYADKLFGVFQRLHAESEFEGTGIGLASVRRIVQRHGGRVWADARPGEGATFYVALPSPAQELAA